MKEAEFDVASPGLAHRLIGRLRNQLSESFDHFGSIVKDGEEYRRCNEKVYLFEACQAEYYAKLREATKRKFE